jgi:exodeoxyribonuclease VII large subunit
VHDFLRIAENRGLGAAIRIYPVPVQGEGAPPKILAAMRHVAAEGWADALILIRGGGSLEDLWAFNDPELAKAIFAFPLPVLAGIGHEVDFTLADMTADVRAATPSHAAQLLWTGRAELAGRVRALSEAMMQAGDRNFEREERRMEHMTRALAMLSPARRVEEREHRLASMLRLLGHAGRFALERDSAVLARLGSGLELAPARLPAVAQRLDSFSLRLGPACARNAANAGHELERASLRLANCDPFAPLERGYALVCRRDGGFVRQKADAAPGQRLSLMVRDGHIPVRVEGEEE